MPSGNSNNKPVVAVCGKGGVGKTVFCALFAKALVEAGWVPMLLVDADPVGGLIRAIGETVKKTIASARSELIASARNAGAEDKSRIARQLDYYLLETLEERDSYSMLAIGRSPEKGCFCPANTLLREAINAVAEPFAFVLIDAEAGVEQIKREVTRNVTDIIVVHDGSMRSAEALEYIADLAGGIRTFSVANRSEEGNNIELPACVRMLGHVPEDEDVRDYDRAGRPLWELPNDNYATNAVRNIQKNYSEFTVETQHEPSE